MTSMNADVLAFFLPLSKDILNDTAVLPIIPLYTGKKTYCNYVYHNERGTDQRGGRTRTSKWVEIQRYQGFLLQRPVIFHVSHNLRY